METIGNANKSVIFFNVFNVLYLTENIIDTKEKKRQLCKLMNFRPFSL